MHSSESLTVSPVSSATGSSAPGSTVERQNDIVSSSETWRCLIFHSLFIFKIYKNFKSQFLSIFITKNANWHVCVITPVHQSNSRFIPNDFEASRQGNVMSDELKKKVDEVIIYRVIGTKLGAL